MPVDPLLQNLISLFMGEAQEICQRLTRNLLDLERATEKAPETGKIYESLARGFHTLKGSTATLGLEELSDLSHRLEDVVAPLRKALVPIPGQTADVILRALDVLLVRVQAHATGQSDDLVDLAETLAAVDRLKAGAAPPHPGAAAQKAAATPKAPAAHAPAPQEAPAPKEAPAPEEMASRAAAVDDEDSWRVGTRQITVLMREVERLREARLRIDERSDEMEGAARALARSKAQLDQAAVRARFQAMGQALVLDAEQIGDVVESLEEGLKAVSTLPLRTVLGPLHRAVRDLCRTTGKEAKLSVVGGELSIDRHILEKLKGPLTHLVRNAVDHGIEKPEVRMSRGKHREGTLTIRVEQQGNLVFIEVADDGGGLSTQAIREEVVRRAMATAEEVAKMDERQVSQYIFHSGFSTRREVTETSGRGVGLDVVRNQIEALQGHVEVQSIAAQGSRFILTIPVDMGSSPIVLVRCGEHQVGIPMLSVESLQPARKEAISVTRSRVQLKYGEQFIPVDDLGALLNVRQPAAPAPGQPLLVVQAEGKRSAIAVDEVVGDLELLLRPLPRDVRDLAAYQGTATLGRGELVLILRTSWLVDHGAQVGVALKKGAERVLVVDDSITARAMHRSALEAGGFTVHTASNGRQALTQLRASDYDALVCDIAMDEIDGVALTAMVRSNPTTAGLPIILVSGRDAQAERDRGLAAGADAFLSKMECVSGRLLTEVSGVISRRRSMRA